MCTCLCYRCDVLCICLHYRCAVLCQYVYMFVLQVCCTRCTCLCHRCAVLCIHFVTGVLYYMYMFVSHVCCTMYTFCVTGVLCYVYMFVLQVCCTMCTWACWLCFAPMPSTFCLGSMDWKWDSPGSSVCLSSCTTSLNSQVTTGKG